MAKRYYYLLGIFILIIILLRIDFHKLLITFSGLNVFLFFLISLLIIPVVFLKSLRWKYILAFQPAHYSTKEAFLVYLSSIYLGLVTPGRVGEASRAFYLRRDKGLALGRGVATVFLDRLYDLTPLLLISLLGLQSFFNKASSQFFLMAALIILAVMSPFVLLKRSVIGYLAKYFLSINFIKKHKIRIKFHYEEFRDAIKKMGGAGAIVSFGITIAGYLVYFTQCYLLMLFLGIEMPFIKVVFFVSITSLVSLIPVTVAGLGTREATLVYLFSTSGRSAEEAVAFSFLFFVSFYLITGVLGFIGWVIKGGSEELFVKSYGT